MRRRLGVLAASALVAAASAASADEITGPVTSIDPTSKTFVVGGTTFTASPHNTVGPKLATLKPGDRVTVFYQTNAANCQPWNVMVIKMAESPARQ